MGKLLRQILINFYAFSPNWLRSFYNCPIKKETVEWAAKFFGNTYFTGPFPILLSFAFLRIRGI